MPEHNEHNFDSTLAVPPRTKIWRSFLLLIVLGLSVYFLMPRLARIDYALQVAVTMRIPFIALALGAQILSYLGSGYLLRAIVRLASSPVSIREGALVTLGANSLGTLGGGVLGTAGVTYLWLRRRGASPGSAALGGWIPIYLNNATLAFVSLLGLLVFIVLRKSSGMLFLGFSLAVLILAGGIGGLLWSLAHRERLAATAMAIAGFIARIRRKAVDRQATEVAIGRLMEAWNALVQSGWRAPATGAALNTGFDMLTLAFLFLAARHGVSPLALIAGYGLPQLLGKLTFILGGVGVVETTMVGLYVVLGVPRAISVVVVLVYRLFSFWLPTLVGIAIVFYFEHRKARPAIL